MRRSPLACKFLLFIFLTTPAAAQSENFKVLEDWLVESNSSNALYLFLASEATALISSRQAQRSQILTREGWLNEIGHLRERLGDVLGPFPKKTPLNAVKTGEIRRDDYRVEKLIFESLPGHHVSAALFLPAVIEEPAPAILFCSGHSEEGFRSEVYQHMILNLVMKGFVVFAFDPLGQGERLQYLDSESNESVIGGPTREHSYIGAQSLLGGISIARYFIWDGIRAIDYLLTRDEVDPGRIGITGRSGGGTQSAYIAAWDKRVAAAAPECYITGFQRLLESIGPQDAEQNFYRGLVEGIDHADLLIARAPAATRIIATTRDFFSIQGFRETFSEARRVYSILDATQQITAAEDDSPHASTRLNRQAMYRFFIEAFGMEADPIDISTESLGASELQVAPTGQVLTSFNGVSIFDIVSQQLEILVKELDRRRADLSTFLPEVVTAAKELSGYRAPAAVESSEAVFRGRFERDGYRVEKYFIAGEGEYVLPLLLFIPSSPGPHPVSLYLQPGGKETESGPGEEIERMVLDGSAVLAADLLGTGELGGGAFKGDAYDFKIGVGDYNRWFFGTLIGRSLSGIRAGDIVRLVRFAKGRSEFDSDRISAFAQGVLGPALLHAAAFDNSIKQVRMRSSLGSFEDLAATRIYDPGLIQSTVAGALEAYDLPDLAATIAPRGLTFEDPLSASGTVLSEAEIQEVFALTTMSYAQESASDRFQIVLTPARSN